jgi:hypothetical protein
MYITYINIDSTVTRDRVPTSSLASEPSAHEGTKQCCACPTSTAQVTRAKPQDQMQSSHTDHVQCRNQHANLHKPACHSLSALSSCHRVTRTSPTGAATGSSQPAVQHIALSMTLTIFHSTPHSTRFGALPTSCCTGPVHPCCATQGTTCLRARGPAWCKCGTTMHKPSHPSLRKVWRCAQQLL